MKIYLDTSSLNRIFDDQSQAKIYLQASAMLLILKLIEDKSVRLVSSEVSVYENDRNPFEERRIFVNSLLKKSESLQKLSPSILKRAQEIEASAISGLDALHLACAEALKADCFITCDDRIIKRYKSGLKALDPVEFITIILKETGNVGR